MAPKGTGSSCVIAPSKSTDDPPQNSPATHGTAMRALDAAVLKFYESLEEPFWSSIPVVLL